MDDLGGLVTESVETHDLEAILVDENLAHPDVVAGDLRPERCPLTRPNEPCRRFPPTGPVPITTMSRW